MACALLCTVLGWGPCSKWGPLCTLTRPWTVQPSGQSHPVASERQGWRRGKQVSFFWVEDGQGCGSEAVGRRSAQQRLSRGRSRHLVRTWPRVPTARLGWLGGHLSLALSPHFHVKGRRDVAGDWGPPSARGAHCAEIRVPPQGWRVKDGGEAGRRLLQGEGGYGPPA